MPVVDVRGWAARNIWPNPAGELAVRPGLRKVYSAASGRRIVGGFSLRVPATMEMAHYIVDVATSGSADCKIRVLDETLTEQYVLEVGNGVPEVITHAEALDQVLISSPQLPTAWGYIGGPLVVADKATREGFTTIAIPRGLVTAWAGRAVFASGSTINFSLTSTVVSPNGIRQLLGENQLNIGSPVVGLHVSARGSLIVVTQAGVYALPVGAAEAGRVIGTWQKLTDYQGARFGTTTKAAGRLFGLSARGFVVADAEGGQEVSLDDPPIPRVMCDRIAANDYRAVCRIFEGRQGPIVAYPDEGAVCMVDTAQGFASWWTWADADEDGRLVGVLREDDGDDVLLTEEGAYAIWGNFDGDEAISEAGTVTGVLAGLLETPADANMVLRRVDVASDTGGSIRAACEATEKTAAPTQRGTVIGTGVWGTATVNTPRLQSKRLQFSKRSHQLAVEVGADHPLSRIAPSVNVETRGPGKRRPG